VDPAVAPEPRKHCSAATIRRWPKPATLAGDRGPPWAKGRGAAASGAVGAWVGRLELLFACLASARLGAHKPSYLRFLLTFGDRWCPLLSAVRPSATDPARTNSVPVPSGRGRLRRFVSPRPATGSAG
jgi:hypothetical protein